MSANGITMESETKDSENVEESESGKDWISRLCYEHGYFCATHPKIVIFFTAVVIFTCRWVKFQRTCTTIVVKLKRAVVHAWIHCSQIERKDVRWEGDSLAMTHFRWIHEPSSLPWTLIIEIKENQIVSWSFGKKNTEKQKPYLWENTKASYKVSTQFFLLVLYLWLLLIQTGFC